MGMIEGFLGGSKVFDSRIFWAGQFGKNFFGWLNLSRDFFSYNLKIRGSARVSLVLRIKYNQTFRVISFSAFWTFLKARKIEHNEDLS